MCPGNLFCGLDIFPLNYFSKFTAESYQLFVVVLLFLIGIFHEKINESNINVPYFIPTICLLGKSCCLSDFIVLDMWHCPIGYKSQGEVSVDLLRDFCRGVNPCPFH